MIEEQSENRRRYSLHGQVRQTTEACQIWANSCKASPADGRSRPLARDFSVRRKCAPRPPVQDQAFCRWPHSVGPCRALRDWGQPRNFSRRRSSEIFIPVDVEDSRFHGFFRRTESVMLCTTCEKSGLEWRTPQRSTTAVNFSGVSASTSLAANSSMSFSSIRNMKFG